MSTPPARTATASKAAVDKSIRELKALYRTGQKSLARHQRLLYGESSQIAAAYNLSAAKLRQARQLAGEHGFTPAEFQDLCAKARKHGYPLGLSLVARLVTVSKRRRTSLINRMLRERWGRRRLEREVYQLRERSVRPGRPVQLPASAEDAKARLLAQVEQWQHLLDRMHAGDADEQGVMADLPEAVQQAAKSVERAMTKLRKALQAKGR